MCSDYTVNSILIDSLLGPYYYFCCAAVQRALQPKGDFHSVWNLVIFMAILVREDKQNQGCLLW
jgi:hypothetical protein